MTDIAQLSIRIDSLEAKVATQNMDRMAESGSRLEKGVKMLAGAWASWELGRHIKDMASLSARYEMMGAAMNVVGNNAGYTASKMADYESKLTATGISMIQARENLTKMAAANLDLAQSSDLARVAQDAARIGNINSSEAFGRMVQGIQSGEQEILRTMGLNVQWEAGYKKLADTMGKNSAELTAQEKLNSRLATVMEEGTKRAGVYEASMGMVGGQMLSMKRYAEDLEVSMGEVFKPSLQVAVQNLNQGFADMRKWSIANRAEMELLGIATAHTSQSIVDCGRAIFGMAGDTTEGMDALLLLRRTLQGIGGIAALTTDSITGIRMAVSDLAGAGMKEMGNQLQSIAHVVDKLPMTGNMSSVLEMTAWELQTGGNLGFKRGDAIANRQLAIEKWYSQLDEVPKRKEWVDKLGTPTTAASIAALGSGSTPGLTAYGREIQNLQEQLRDLTMSERDAYEAKLKLMDDGSKGDVSKAMGIWDRVDALKKEKALTEELVKRTEEGTIAIARKAEAERAREEQNRNSLIQDAERLNEQGSVKAELARLNAINGTNRLDPGVYEREFLKLQIQGSETLTALSYGLEGMGHTATDAFGAWVSGMDGASLSFSKMTRQMAGDMARLTAQKGWESLMGYALHGLGTWLGSGYNATYNSNTADMSNQMGGDNYVPYPTLTGGSPQGQVLSGGSSNVQSSVVVNVHPGGAVDAQAGGTGLDGVALGKQIKGAVLGIIAEQQQFGGMLAKR